MSLPEFSTCHSGMAFCGVQVTKLLKGLRSDDPKERDAAERGYEYLREKVPGIRKFDVCIHFVVGVSIFSKK